MKKNILLIFMTILCVYSFGQEKKQNDENKIEFDDFFFKAMKEKAEENFVSEIMFLERCREIDSLEFTVYYELGKAYFKIKDLEKTQYNLLKAQELSPQNTWILEDIVNYYDFISDRENSIRWLERLCSVEPKYKEILLERYIQNENYDVAIKLVDSMLLDPSQDINRLYVLKKDIYYYRGDYQSAVDICDERINSEPKNEEWVLSKVYIYSSINENEKALNTLIEYNKKYPEKPLVNLALANYYVKNGNIEETIKHTIPILKNETIDNNARVELLFSLFEIEIEADSLDFYFKDIIGHLQEHQSEKPRYSLILYTYYKKKGDETNAFTSIDNFIHNSQETPSKEVYLEYLIALSRKNDFKLLYSESDKVIKIYPLFALPYLVKGSSASTLGNEKEALKIFEEGLELAKGDKNLESEFYSSIADIYYKRKDYQKCYEHYEKSIILNPSNYSAMNNYSYYLALEKENLQKAKDFMEIVIYENPKNPNFLDTYAWVYYQLGEYKKALEIIEKAIYVIEVESKEQDSSEVREHYGDILIKNGLKQEAINQWEKAKSFGKNEREISKKIKNAK